MEKELVIMLARFKTTCPRCKKPIPRNDLMLWDKSTNKAIHFGCNIPNEKVVNPK